MQEEIILENCRLCYTHQGLHELSTNEELITQILDILKIQVNDSLQDFLPARICEDCFSILTDFAEYQQKIKLIDESLRNSALNDAKKIKIEYISYETRTNATEFECHMCPSVLQTETALHEHILSHGIDKIVSNIRCKTCKKTFGNKRSFKRHNCSKQKLCLNCMQDFKTDEEYNVHVCAVEVEVIEEVMEVDEKDVELEKITLKTDISDCGAQIVYIKEETKEKIVNCPYCESTFSTNNELKLHKEAAHKNQFVCSWENCDKVFSEKRYLENHVKKHKDIREFLCQTCGKGFLTKTSLVSHERTHTAKRGDFHCESCKKDFKSRCALRLHVRKVHECVRYYCAQCGLSYRSKHSLQRHEMTHTGIKDWPCDLCPKAFYSKKDLARHKRYHLGVRRHKCEECSALFFEKEYLKIHSRIHTGERPYVCELPNCGKGFVDSYKLKRHQKCKHN